MRSSFCSKNSLILDIGSSKRKWGGEGRVTRLWSGAGGTGGPIGRGAGVPAGEHGGLVAHHSGFACHELLGVGVTHREIDPVERGGRRIGEEPPLRAEE